MKKLFWTFFILIFCFFINSNNEVFAQSQCQQFDNNETECSSKPDCGYYLCNNKCLPYGTLVYEACGYPKPDCEQFNDISGCNTDIACSWYSCTNRCLPSGTPSEQVCKETPVEEDKSNFKPVDISSLTVKPYIIVPKDKEYIPLYIHGVYEVNLEVQKWYAKQLEGKTFKLDPIRVFYSEKTAKELGCGSVDCPEGDVTSMWGNTQKELEKFGGEGIVLEGWVVGGRLTALGWGWGSLTTGFTLMGDINLDAASNLYPNGPTGADCAVMGGEDYCTQDQQVATLAHELGHAMNLDSWGDSDWHTLGFENRLSIMGGGVWQFSKAVLLDTKLNPEKSSLTHRFGVKQESQNKPKIDRITPSDGQYNDKIEIFGSNFGKAEDKNVILFGTSNQLAPDTRGTLGQTVSWSDNHITAWIFKPYSTDIRVLTKSGLSNSVFLTVKESPPDTKQFNGLVTCPGTGADGVNVILSKVNPDGSEEELTGAVANQAGRWSLNYPLKSDENIKYDLKLRYPKSNEILKVNKNFDYFSINNKGDFISSHGERFANGDIYMTLDGCPHLDATKAQLTINGQRGEFNLDSNQPLNIGVVISNKDDSENHCIAGLKSEDIRFDWLPMKKNGKAIAVKTLEPIQNCQSVNVLPPEKAGSYWLRVSFEGTEIFQISYDYITFKLNPSKTTPTINGQGFAEAKIGDKVSVSIKISPLQTDQCIAGIESEAISLAWQGQNQDIPITVEGLQNCQPVLIPVPDIGGNFSLKTSFFGNDEYGESEGIASLDVKKIPLKVQTIVNGSKDFTPQPNEPINVGVRITALDNQECISDLDHSRIFLSWVKPNGDELPISKGIVNCQPLIPIPPPDQKGLFKLKSTFAGDIKYDHVVTEKDDMANLNITDLPVAVGGVNNIISDVNQTISNLTGQSSSEEQAALEKRIITEIKVDDLGVDPTNPDSVPINLEEHGCQENQECDYPVRIAVSYSVGESEFFVLNLHYKPKAPIAQGSTDQTKCPIWETSPNKCSGCGLADVYEQDSCDTTSTRLIIQGIEDGSCQIPEWCGDNSGRPTPGADYEENAYYGEDSYYSESSYYGESSYESTPPQAEGVPSEADGVGGCCEQQASPNSDQGCLQDETHNQVCSESNGACQSGLSCQEASQ